MASVTRSTTTGPAAHKPPDEGLLGEQDRGGRVGKHERNPVGRILGSMGTYAAPGEIAYSETTIDSGRRPPRGEPGPAEADEAG
jgi:hypothetical protein